MSISLFLWKKLWKKFVEFYKKQGLFLLPRELAIWYHPQVQQIQCITAVSPNDRTLAASET